MISINRFTSPMGEITLYTITNASGACVTLSTLGAGIVAVNVPDRNGNLGDVVLGYENVADYCGDGPCMGKVPGRYANRIASGIFALDGKEYKLAVNCGPNALHGGPTGFANRMWQALVIGDNAVEFTYHSADGEEGYPGNLIAKAMYIFTEDNRLELSLSATTDAPTVVNLTNHAYFNLDGEAAGSVLDHKLRLACSQYLPTDPSLVPTGEFAPVEGTPMDFTVAKPLNKDIKADFPAIKYAKGYDNCWAVDGAQPGRLVKVAKLSSDKSGRTLTVYSTQPAVQIYTGNWLDDSPMGKHGKYHDYDGVAIECQGMPDAPNKPEFPSQRLNPGEEYSHRIVFSFDAE